MANRDYLIAKLGDGFEVRRAPSSEKRQMVGPFIFFDQMGPAQSCGTWAQARRRSRRGLSRFGRHQLRHSKAGTTLPWAPGDSTGLPAHPASQ
jgi:hypothetical protein